MAILEVEGLLTLLRQAGSQETGPADEAALQHLSMVRRVLGVLEVHFWWREGEEDWQGLADRQGSRPTKGTAGRNPLGPLLNSFSVASACWKRGGPVLAAACREAEEGAGQAILLVVGGDAFSAGWSEELLRALLVGLLASRAAAAAGERLSRSQSDLQALCRISSVISSSGDFSMVLGKCIEQMQDIIGASGGGVLLYDPRSNKLVLQRPAFGDSAEGFHGYSLDVTGEERAGMGAAVRAFLTGRPYICNSPTDDPVSNRQIIELYGVRRSLTVPLVMDSKRLGVLHLVNKRGGDFNQGDARLASLLASQLAVVIVNARLFAQADTQNNLLERAINIHDRLTQMVLQGRGVDTITATLAQLLGRPVQVEDPFLRLIAFAAPPGDNVAGLPGPEVLAEEVLAAPEVADFFSRLQQAQRPLSFTFPEQHGLSRPRIMAAIKVGGETLGYVSALVADRCLEELDFIALEHAATVYALKFMQQKVACEVEERIQGRFVEDLVYGRVKEERDLLERARYLGYDPHHVYYVMIVLASRSGEGEGHSGEKEAGLFEPEAVVLDLVRLCAAERGLRVITARANPLLVLVDSGPTADDPKIEGLAGAVCKRLQNAGREQAALVCLGAPASGLRDMQLSYRQAEMALKMARRYGWQNAVVPYRGLGIFRVLLHVDNRQALEEYLQDVLGALLAYDRERNGNLLSTLRAYLENNCNAQRTAARLFIHLNTLKYRLQRIREVARLDLDDHEQRLNIQLALKMFDVL